MSTRPRIEFNNEGLCNACQWSEEKKVLDWTSRKTELLQLLDKYRSKTGSYDCMVPVSGGKDGSYVAYQLKHKYGMNPLCVTVRPPLSLEIGNKNLEKFISAGYDHIHISPNSELMKKLNKQGFIEKGSPYFGWLTAIFTTVIKNAVNYDIPLIFYGEDGEIEYGGSTKTKNKPLIDIEYMKKVYLEGGYDKILGSTTENAHSDSYFWKFPTDKQLEGKELFATHWSYFEAWDSYRNYLVAKEYCGLQEQEEGNSGTFTNFAQNDQALYALHTYLMYLKFGFGRATQDAGIEIRRGAMTREQAVNLVTLYDGHYPEEFEELYLDYFEMTREEYIEVLHKWTNRDLFEYTNNELTPKFSIR